MKSDRDEGMATPGWQDAGGGRSEMAWRSPHLASKAGREIRYLSRQGDDSTCMLRPCMLLGSATLLRRHEQLGR